MLNVEKKGNDNLKKEHAGFSGKIAIATNDRKRITGHIGRCRSFLICEISDGKIINKEVRENQFTQHRKGGQHHQHHGEGGGRHSHTHLINGLKDCNYLISRGGGWRVVEDLKQYNITTLFTDVEIIDDAVDKFIRGELKNETDLVCDHSED
jgi:predicted Fe-Mo cluster-binding NifX family protein